MTTLQAMSASNITVSQFINQTDKTNFTLYAKWEDTYFKIMILRSDTLPLSGKMHINDKKTKDFLDHLDESFEIYMEKTRQAFSNKNTEIQFFLQDDIFSWKQQDSRGVCILTRGEITVYPFSNILKLSEILKQSLELYQIYQEQVLKLENMHDKLKESEQELSRNLTEIIQKKITMEDDLYTKFKLLLNKKKEMIRKKMLASSTSKDVNTDVDDKKMAKIIEEIHKKAESESDNDETIRKLVFDATTDDESEQSDIESKKLPSSTSFKIGVNKNGKITPKNKRNLKRSINFSSSEDSEDSEDSPKPSTSKSNIALQNLDVDTVVLKRVLDPNFRDHPERIIRKAHNSKKIIRLL